ncbi:MAG: ATP-binding protein [Paludibacteraceae bacterium]|nr:ATP-binding protein [Paludibacteraceae bacterium]
MTEKLIGRNEEINQLHRYFNSTRAEFVALYGRRRVGKTFLVRHLYGDTFAFHVTGIMNGDKRTEMAAFIQALKQYGYKGTMPKTWLDAFFALQQLLESRIEKGHRCLVFIDELPCFDTPKAGFVSALSNFWNNWANWVSEVMLIVCGSATSWMVSNIIDNHGGLHNRITHEMHLHPFSLHETEEFFIARNSPWTRSIILQAYMAVGGVPYYLGLFNNDESLAEGLDRLFFCSDGELAKEYGRLYSSLFSRPEAYLRVITLLAHNKMGLTRQEISELLGIESNGHLSEILQNLVYCDLVRYLRVKSTKIKTTEGIYQLTDFYTIFYHHFHSQKDTNEHYWSTHLGRPELNSWLGLSYERVCMAHIPQILKKLKIDGIATQCYSWRKRGKTNAGEKGAQIDLIIERADQMINLCEIKYSTGQYLLDSEEELKINNRIEAFRNETGTQCGILTTVITTNGLIGGVHSTEVHAQIVLDDLFVE